MNNFTGLDFSDYVYSRRGRYVRRQSFVVVPHFNLHYWYQHSSHDVVSQTERSNRVGMHSQTVGSNGYVCIFNVFTVLLLHIVLHLRSINSWLKNAIWPKTNATWPLSMLPKSFYLRYYDRFLFVHVSVYPLHIYIVCLFVDSEPWTCGRGGSAPTAQFIVF